MGNVVRPVNSMIVSPLSYFSGCETSSLVRSNTVWNTMTIDEAFCQSVNGGFSRGITCRKGKSITRISIYSSKNKTLSFPRRKWSNVVNLPPGCWLVNSRNGVISGALCWSLLLADLALSSTVARKSMLLSSSRTPISATMANLFMCPLGNDRDGWGERLTVHRTGHLIHLIIELLLS